MNVMTPLLGSAESGRTLLVRPGLLAAVLGLSRAQVNVRATALGADGATWSDHGGDVPRFFGAAGRLLLEGQRTNLVSNPRGEGSILGQVGSGGSLPSGWTVAGPGTAVEIMAIGTLNGLPSVTVRYSAPAGIAGSTVRQTFTNSMALATGATYTASVLAAQAGGTLTNVNATRITVDNEGGGVLFTLTAEPKRVVRSLTATGTASNRNPCINYTVVSNQPFDFSVTYAAPQLEAAAFASTPILPGAGNPAASTRGADMASASVAALGLGGPCTVLLSGLIAQATPPDAGEQVILQLDDGSDANRFLLRKVAGAATASAGRVTAGAALDGPSLGGLTPGAPFRLGLVIDGSGRVAACLDGGTVQVVSGGPAAGLTTLRLGNTAAQTAAMFGELRNLVLLRYAIPDAKLPALVAALPA